MNKVEMKRFLNRGRLLAQMLSVKALRRKHFPLYVNLIINSRCNLKCSYCYGQYPMRKTPDWSLEAVKKTVDDLYERGTRYIVVHGGETLLHRHIDEIIGYIASKGIVVGTVTNGQLPARLLAMKNLDKLDYLAFSLDGNREGNDKIRGKGAFDRVMESIQVARKKNNVPIRINSTLTKHVIHDIDFMAEFVRENGFSWGINYLFKLEQQGGKEDLAPTSEQIAAAQAKLLDYKRRGYPINLSAKVMKYISDWPVSYSKKSLGRAEALERLGSKAIECQQGSYQVVIDEDGKVYPCSSLQGSFEAKNIKDGLDAALKHCATRDCYTCYLTSMIESSAIINWDLGVIFENILAQFKRATRSSS